MVMFIILDTVLCCWASVLVCLCEHMCSIKTGATYGQHGADAVESLRRYGCVFQDDSQMNRFFVRHAVEKWCQF